MEKSIFETIKAMLNGGYDDSFDDDIMFHINAAFAELTDIGVGPPEGFIVESKKDKWEDFVLDVTVFELVQQYIYTSVRLTFDPPTNSSLLKAMQELQDRLTWRLADRSGN